MHWGICVMYSCIDIESEAKQKAKTHMTSSANSELRHKASIITLYALEFDHTVFLLLLYPIKKRLNTLYALHRISS